MNVDRHGSKLPLHLCVEVLCTTSRRKFYFESRYCIPPQIKAKVHKDGAHNNVFVTISPNDYIVVVDFLQTKTETNKKSFKCL